MITESSKKMVNIDKVCRWLEKNLNKYTTAISDNSGQPTYVGFNKMTLLGDLRKALKSNSK